MSPVSSRPFPHFSITLSPYIKNLINIFLRHISMPCKATGLLSRFLCIHSITHLYKFGDTKFIPLYLVMPNISTLSLHIIQVIKEGDYLKTRKLELGNRNIVGARVTEARSRIGMKQIELLAKLQVAGIEISVPALSLLEGQKRPVSDKELAALADILGVSVDWLLGREQ